MEIMDRQERRSARSERGGPAGNGRGCSAIRWLGKKRWRDKSVAWQEGGAAIVEAGFSTRAGKGGSVRRWLGKKVARQEGGLSRHERGGSARTGPVMTRPCGHAVAETFARARC